MALEHLNGRRTGRPRGAKTRSRALRDIRWAYNHLGKPDAKPPSPGAKLWADLALSGPARFLTCVANLEAAGESKGQGPGERQAPEPGGPEAPTGNGSSAKPPLRIRKLFLDAQHLLLRLTGDGTAWVSNLPRGAYIVGAQADPSREGIVFTLYAETFPPVTAGNAIPELTAEFSRSR
jgi:hypothetical protein